MLTSRWEPLRDHDTQQAYYRSTRRFLLNHSGRRSGKTEFAKRRLALKAVESTIPGARFFAAAPIHQQARDIFWHDMRALIPRQFVRGTRESDMTIHLVNGVVLRVVGLDMPARIEGGPIDGIVITEMGNCRAETWPHHVRPALSTPGRPGWALIEGTPEGRNHYYELYKQALDDPEWGVYWWKSADILDPGEVASAKRHLDPQTFRQEYEGDWVTWEGQAYYRWGDHNKRENEYDPTAELLLGFDFNVKPGIVTMWQERQEQPGLDIVRGVGEIYKREHSNTFWILEQIKAIWGQHKGPVIAYGDRTGKSHHTSAKLPDWDLIEEELTKLWGPERFDIDLPRVNPPERTRLMTLNAHLQSADDTIRLYVDPVKQPETCRDFDATTLDGSGELDKKLDKGMWTHCTDSVGYVMCQRRPLDDLLEQYQYQPSHGMASAGRW